MAKSEGGEEGQRGAEGRAEMVTNENSSIKTEAFPAQEMK